MIAPPTEHSVKEAVAVSSQSCTDKPKPLTESAIYCTNGDQQYKDTYLTIVEQSHGEIRVALLDLLGAPIDADVEGYITLAKTVAIRL